MAARTACQVFQRRFTSAAAALRPSPVEVRSQRNAVFSREQARQRALYPRTEKIEVSMQGPGLDGTLLIMNKGMSTPLSCARHLTEHHVTNSVLALVDGKPCPLHQPLTDSCSLTLLTFKDNDPTLVNQIAWPVLQNLIIKHNLTKRELCSGSLGQIIKVYNKAYWRSCAALLGYVLETAFKDNYTVQLLSTPEVPVTTGAFCCDVVLDPQLDSWTPSEEALRSLTRQALHLIHQNLAWEPLEVVPSVALEVFSYSRCKQEEVEQKASQNPKGTVLLYRCGDHVLLSGGPLVARTGLCSQYEVTALHNLEQGSLGLHRRAQGISLPLQLLAHHTVWRKLRQRAEKLVNVPVPEEATPPSPPDSTQPPTSQ